jgi:ribosomal protein L15
VKKYVPCQRKRRCKHKMKLGELKPAEERVSRRRVGRGIGSGLGKTSGRGHKGQKARSGGGVRRGFEGGQTPLYRRLPKRGFNNIHAKNYTEVTLTMLNKSTVADVTAETLLADGIIGKVNDGIVVLATGKLDKKLNVKATRFTAKAKEQIEALGGKAEVI